MPLLETLLLRCLRRSLCPSLPGCGSKTASPLQPIGAWLALVSLFFAQCFWRRNDWPLCFGGAAAGAMLMALLNHNFVLWSPQNSQRIVFTLPLFPAY